MADTTAPVPAKPIPAKSKPLMTVVATRPGTYPNPGDTYAIYRDTGAVFTLNNNDHFADADASVDGWMREATDDTVAAARAEAEASKPHVPQTAARGQRHVSGTR